MAPHVCVMFERFADKMNDFILLFGRQMEYNCM